MREKDFQKTAEEWKKIGMKLRDKCMEYLTSTLKENGGLIEWDYLNMPENVCVTYDGGDYPETEANPYSIVHKVKIKDGKIYLDTEDCYDQPVTYLSTEELYNVCDYIERYKEYMGIE